MPSRNRLKDYVADSFYHIYNRGVNKQKIFYNDVDYAVFLNLFKRHLSTEEINDNKGRSYTKLYDDIELLAYCLMSNHFHLLVYQIDPHAMQQLLLRTMTAYVAYINSTYSRVGPLFQDRYKASRIADEPYLWNISRYIHRNPSNWEDYEFSSYPYYTGHKQADWLNHHRILDMHHEIGSDYTAFMSDTADYKQSESFVVTELAN